jgi:hypothetical protein
VSPEGKLWLRKTLQWKILQTLHQFYHLGLDNTLVLVKKLFGGTKLWDIAQQVVQECETCLPQIPIIRLQVPGPQRQGYYPREDWQLDFTHMPG